MKNAAARPSWRQAAAMSHQARLSGPSPVEQQATVLHWQTAEVQGCTGKPGDKPSIAGAHPANEQFPRTAKEEAILRQPR